MHLKKITYMVSLLAGFSPFTRAWAAVPQTEITNGIVQLKVYLPDTAQGFYRGTRFDWSGIVADLRYKGHSYYGPWFSRTDPKVRDFVYDGADIIAGPCSAATGPAEEFTPALGFDEAKAGGTFIKIGVGVLRKPDNESYNSYRVYELVDGGARSIKREAASIEFRQEVHDASSGYGYVYTKTLKLVGGKPEMLIEHTLKNVGTRSIHVSTYNHNFLVLDKESPGPAYKITLPFKVAIDEVTNKGLAGVQSDQIVYLKTLTGEERVYTGIEGFNQSAEDYRIRIENTNVRAGMVISGNRRLARMSLWSIRTVLAAEPFVDVAVDAGSESSWSYQYEYYTF